MGRTLHINDDSYDLYSRKNQLLSEILTNYGEDGHGIYTKTELIEKIKSVIEDLEAPNENTEQLNLNGSELKEKIRSLMSEMDGNSLNEYCDYYDGYVFDDDDKVNNHIIYELIKLLVDELDEDMKSHKLKILSDLCQYSYMGGCEVTECIKALSTALLNLKLIDENNYKEYFREYLVDILKTWIFDSTDLLNDYNKEITKKGFTASMHKLYQEKYKKDYFPKVLEIREKLLQELEIFKDEFVGKQIVHMTYN